MDTAAKGLLGLPRREWEAAFCKDLVHAQRPGHDVVPQLERTEGRFRGRLEGVVDEAAYLDHEGIAAQSEPDSLRDRWVEVQPVDTRDDAILHPDSSVG